jgi:dihydrofolate reductase
MRPLRYSINLSLDGCIDHEAMSPTDDMHRHATAMLSQADALMFGRTTYELMEAGWREPDEDLPEWTQPFARTITETKKYVVSSTLDHVDWENTELVRGDVAEFVRRLKELPGRGLYVGGVQLPMALAELGLIDEYELVVHPRIVGRGPTLFAGLVTHVDLRLVDSTQLGSGAVVLRYVPQR